MQTKARSISFVFQDKIYKNFEEFQADAAIGSTNISKLENPIEITRAGIIGHEALLKTPWGDKRLAEKAVNK